MSHFNENSKSTLGREKSSKSHKVKYRASGNAHPILKLQEKMGNQWVQRNITSDFALENEVGLGRNNIQPKLKVGQPDDRYEQEADRVAEQVMRMAGPLIQMQPEEEEELHEKPITKQITPLVQRQPEPEEEEEEEELQPKLIAEQITPLVQRQEEEAEEPGEAPEGEIPEEEEEDFVQTKYASYDKKTETINNLEFQIDSARSGGWPLSQKERAFFEPRFGQDFSGVRVHTGARAAESAKGFNAKAYTVGSDVVFGAGQYSPGTPEGQRLLGHELTHVVQQDNNIPFIQLSPESDLISEHTSWGNLNEERLGYTLLSEALDGKYNFIMRVLDELGSTDRDDVSLEFLKITSDINLDIFASTDSGRRMLDRLYDEITSGSLSEEESKQAQRILKAKVTVSPEEYEIGVKKAKIFPFRLPGITVFTDAPIMAERRPKGKIWVRMPTRVYSSSKFREEVRTLPTEVFIGGFELPENEIIGVKMYDLGGEVHYRPALYLIQLSNETTTKVFETMGEAAGLGLTLGSGALIGAGAKGVSWGAKALMWADRAASFFGTLTTILRDHRGWIIEQMGDDGKEFMHYVDMVNSALLIYGGARAVFSMGQLIHGFKKSYKKWDDVASSIDTELSSGKKSAVTEIKKQADEYFDSFDEAIKAKQTKAPSIETPSVKPKKPTTKAPTAPPKKPTGAELARKLDYKDAEPGYHWRNVGGKPVYSRNPNFKGPKKRYDPVKREFYIVKETRRVGRPRLPRGSKVPRLKEGEDFRLFPNPVRRDLRDEHKRILDLAETDPQRAGREYQNLIAHDIKGEDVQEIFREKGRVMDVGKYHEITIQGWKKGFGTKKLDQFWLDLRDRDKILLTVPRLSEKAADQLMRLGAQAETVFDKDVLIIVRQTL